jgi:AcrR family transcriptional regulator
VGRPSSRDKILDALVEVLLEGGVGAVTLDAVCARAGVSKGGLLYHFGSKADLFDGLTDRLAAGIREQIAAAPTDTADMVRWFLRISTADLDGDEHETAIWRALVAGIRAEGEGESTGTGIVALLAEWAEPLRGLDPVLAEEIRLVADGLCLNGLVGAPPPDPKVVDALVESLARRAAEG